MKQVHFEIDKKAFEGPFRCHNRETILVSRKMAVSNNSFTYSVWECPTCKKEFLDSTQAKRMELIWSIEKLLSDRAVKMKRSLNFDGKMFFLRFPMEWTKQWQKGDEAQITFVDTKKMIIEVIHS